MEKRGNYKMTKLELIKEVAEVAEVTQTISKKVYEAVESVIASALENGDEEVKLGFATIKVTRKEAYTARNPKTQEPVDVPAKNVAKAVLSAPTKRAVAQ